MQWFPYLLAIPLVAAVLVAQAMIGGPVWGWTALVVLGAAVLVLNVPPGDGDT